MLGSRHDDMVTPPFSIADMRCSIANAGVGFRDKIVGFSVESASFTNFMRNVPPKLTKMKIQLWNSTVYDQGATLEVQVPPGHYDIDSFVAAMQAAFNEAASPNAPFMAIARVQEPGQPTTIGYILNENFGNDPTGHVTIEHQGPSLTRVIGINRQETLTINPLVLTTRKPLLGGVENVFVHSDAITGAKKSLGGHETPNSVIATIPVTVPYGFTQTIQFEANSTRPTVVYDVSTPSSISTVDYSFRDADLSVIDLQSGEISLTVRLWIHVPE